MPDGRGREPVIVAMPDEIALVVYDSRWPQKFALESARIRSVLAEPTLEIEHHGSTASILFTQALPAALALVAVVASSRR